MTYIYKVVRVKPDGKFKSCCMDHPSLECTYTLGLTTVPKVGKLFVWRYAHQAKEFLRNTPWSPVLINRRPICDLAILKGTATDIQEYDSQYLLSAIEFPRAVDWWEGVYTAPQQHKFRPYIGTYACTSFTPKSIYQRLER